MINSYYHSREMQGLLLVGKLLELHECGKMYVIIDSIRTIIILKLLFFFLADPCHHYSNLSDANRNENYITRAFGPTLCDSQLAEGWYRFVGAAGTKMPTKRVPAFRCGTNWSGWLMTAHPTIEDGEVSRMVCFSDRSTGCKVERSIFVKNCGLYYIYKLLAPQDCPYRFCGTAKCEAKKLTK